MARMELHFLFVTSPLPRQTPPDCAWGKNLRLKDSPQSLFHIPCSVPPVWPLRREAVVDRRPAASRSPSSSAQPPPWHEVLSGNALSCQRLPPHECD
eukprot:11087043-Alexandrium_andersonii.AAC.1